MTNETTQLARCPFCGGEAECIEFDGYRPSSPKTYRVSCNDEDCTMQSAEYRTEEDAIAAWNTRAESAELAALRQQVADLTETLAFAAQYKGIEGRSCPLCKYENGVFVESCQMHKDMDKLRQQVAALMDMLERRQRCEECHGSGAVWMVDYANDDVTPEPCLCWSEAEDLLAKYDKEAADHE